MAALSWCLLLGATAGACSMDNREGPDVTCEDLACGRINACQNGIIAQCADGVVVRFRVCQDAAVCERDWQTLGEYRCSESDTDCEGCRPERVESCNWLDPREILDGEVGGSGGEGGSGGGYVRDTAQ
jgi:hypothetical protein